MPRGNRRVSARPTLLGDGFRGRPSCRLAGQASFLAARQRVDALYRRTPPTVAPPAAPHDRSIADSSRRMRDTFDPRHYAHRRAPGRRRGRASLRRSVAARVPDARADTAASRTTLARGRGEAGPVAGVLLRGL